MEITKRLTFDEVYATYNTWRKIEPRTTRFGQYFLNTHFPDMPCPEIYYLKFDMEAFAKIISDPRLCAGSE